MLQDLLNHPDRKKWCTLVRHLLYGLGFQHVWLKQNIGNVELFLLKVKQRICHLFLQNWSSRLNGSSRVLFYCHISNLMFQTYLDVVTIPEFRIYLRRLRVHLIDFLYHPVAG